MKVRMRHVEWTVRSERHRIEITGLKDLEEE